MIATTIRIRKSFNTSSPASAESTLESSSIVEVQGHPRSKTIFQTPSASSRQIELKVPIRLPSGSKTGPEVRPSEPESSTETTSGRHENGAASPSKNGAHAC